MEYSEVERVILERFSHKSRSAGGPRLGYLLRKRAICCVESEHPDLDFNAGLDRLVDKGLVKRNEGGDLYFLTQEGVETVKQL